MERHRSRSTLRKESSIGGQVPLTFLNEPYRCVHIPMHNYRQIAPGCIGSDPFALRRYDTIQPPFSASASTATLAQMASLFSSCRPTSTSVSFALLSQRSNVKGRFEQCTCTQTFLSHGGCSINPSTIPLIAPHFYFDAGGFLITLRPTPMRGVRSQRPVNRTPSRRVKNTIWPRASLPLQRKALLIRR